MLLKKGSAYNANFTSTDYPTLTTDWTGVINFYSDYPDGSIIFTKTLVRTSTAMTLNLTIGEIIALANGVYYAEVIIQNTVLAVTIDSLLYATVVDLPVVGGDYCTLYITIAKTDGTAAGESIQTMSNTVIGGVNTLTITNEWKGIDINIDKTIASNDSGIVIDNERVVMTTNMAGYAECRIIKGIVVKISSSYFGGVSFTVDTTGHDSIDLSTLF